MPVQISDDAGVRNFVYNSFNEIDTEEQCKLSCFVHPYLWLITWDPTQPVATRPLAIQKDGTWYTYGWDLTKNICEIFGQNGYIRNTYAYTPFGAVSASGDVEQPIQWSSEYYDNELALVYYNYRHYNPTDGRWINRDPITEQGGWNLYVFVGNKLKAHDVLGLVAPGYEEAQAIVLLNKINSTTNTPQNDKLYYKSEELWGWGHWGKITLHSKNDFTPNLHMKTNCIKYLSVAGHGNYEEKYKTASVQWGIDILYEGPTERKCDTQISSMFIGIKFCSSCTVEILSCYIGKSIYLKERLKRITGCKIITYDGPTM